ncbi:DNA polymerase III subunit chi [Altererythrobacter lauratis]|uniref:DNA polymerase III subunit chi n=1 Tax=Alteraurantiacibacter lauratis TaxID=2054627 RepID=A0ABV7EJE8_9SPHN
MRVGFYLHGNQPVERVLPQIARAALGQGQRLLVVSGDDAQLAALDKALWEQFPEHFLAHGFAGGPHDARQPVLLADSCANANGAEVVALADGQWREEAATFPRAILLFDENARGSARAIWRQFDGKTDVEREFFEIEGGKWVRKA